MKTRNGPCITRASQAALNPECEFSVVGEVRVGEVRAEQYVADSNKRRQVSITS